VGVALDTSEDAGSGDDIGEDFFNLRVRVWEIWGFFIMLAM